MTEAELGRIYGNPVTDAWVKAYRKATDDMMRQEGSRLVATRMTMGATRMNNGPVTIICEDA
jgi:hypothetical protein